MPEIAKKSSKVVAVDIRVLPDIILYFLHKSPDNVQNGLIGLSKIKVMFFVFNVSNHLEMAKTAEIADHTAQIAILRFLVTGLFHTFLALVLSLTDYFWAFICQHNPRLELFDL